MKATLNLVGFDYADENIVAELRRNISALISTPAGTCAGDRSYGIDMTFLSLPVSQAANFLALELAEKIPLYEPRADVDSVSFESDNDGVLTANIYIIPNEDYLAEEDEEDEDVSD